MKKQHLFPLALFCLVFLAYSLYFVKVISVNYTVEKNSISKEIQRRVKTNSLESIVKNMKLLDEPQAKFVNYAWLNVREQPSLSSLIIKRLQQNDEVKVLGYPTSSWAYVMTNEEKKGFVSRRYLSAKPITNIRTEVLTNKKAPSISFSKKTTPKVTPPVLVPAKTTGSLRAPDIYEVPIILYHHITDEVGKYPKNLSLATINFTTQLDYLVEHGFKTITFHELKAASEGKISSPEKSVILTFDDGYDDHYIVAQHLNGKGLKGVFFIITDKIGTPGYLDWRQVKKMRSWGMEIGSHGVVSAELSNSTSFYMDKELVNSKKIIESQLGEPIISFSYPAGKYNRLAMQAVEKAGYSFARSINSGSRFKKDQFYKLPSLRVFPPAGAKQFRVWLGE